MHKLYGRRKGKKLRQRQDTLVEKLLPEVSVDLSPDVLTSEKIFGAPYRALRLEIGFGDGARLISEAASNPETAFIGCEPFLNGVAKALAAMSDRRLPNMRLHCGDARDLLDRLSDGCVDGIELLYPDPWPKRRHRKRRIVSDEFLTAAARVLKSGAVLRFATDIDDYSGWTLARVLPRKDLRWLAERPSDWLTPWEGWSATRYEQKARSEGRTSAYLSFVKT